jgi:drug/metabolite transporter (DMT)-like permease
MLYLALALRILSNPFSNVFQKSLAHRRADPVFIIAATHALLTIVAAPIFFARLPRDGAFWQNILIVAVLTVAGNVLIVLAVKTSDLSLLGPINAYQSVVSLVPAMVLLHEFPKPQGLAGIGLIVAGSYFIVDRKLDQPHRNVFLRFFEDRGVQYRLAALVISAVEAVFLKRALLASTPTATFAGWAVLGFGASLIPTFTLTSVPQQLRAFKTHLPTYLALATTTGVMQFCTIFTFGAFRVGNSLALFQTSTLLTVFLGYKVFREPNILERLLGSCVMIAGAVLIMMSH